MRACTLTPALRPTWISGMAKKYTMWLADYRKNYNTTLTRDMHQYTSSGTVAGIGGRVDCNRAYVTSPRSLRERAKTALRRRKTSCTAIL